MPSLKTYFVALIAIFASSAFGQNSDESGLLNHSIATQEQVDELISVVEESMGEDQKIRSYEAVNAKLREMSLPLIDISGKDPQVNPATIIGYMGSTNIGASINDGKHLYCLPCTTDVHNTFVYGIVESPPWYERVLSNYW